MTTRPTHVWTADAPAEIGYAWAARGDGEFTDLHGDGLLYRDLGLGAASDGALTVHHIKLADAQAATEWRTAEADMDFLYLLAGSATVEDSHGGGGRFEAGGCAVLGAVTRFRLGGVSDDFEAIRITAGYGEESSFAPVYTHETPDQYVKGNGPRAFFSYRDLGTRGPTGGRIHVHIVRASEPGPGTDWHYHSMAQWFMVIGGTSTIRVEGRPAQPLELLDAMCVGRGPQMRHNVTKFSGDYAVLEMCIPAEYETIAVDAPEGAQPD
jgi:hypothetical protein